jgi:small subunit ribosomal protein S5
MPEILDESSQLESTTIGVYRTASTVKGGRRFSFGALVVVGNRRGQVGYGYGKANEVPQAIEKAQKYAKRSMVDVTRIGTTIHHEVEGKFSASKVRLIPAAPGTGVVAGGVVRAIMDMAGVADCLSKCYGSTNARNTVKAVFDGLGQLSVPEQVGMLRGQDLGKTDIILKIEASKTTMATTAGPKKSRGPVNTVADERKGRGRGGPGGGGGGGGRGPRRGPMGGGGGGSDAGNPAAGAEAPKA